MKKRWEGQMHPITKPIILISYGLAVIWVLWVTLIAFIGGTLPVLGWEVKGGIVWGVLSIACLWPVASALFFLAFQALDAFAWWMNENLSTLLRSKDKSTNTRLNPSHSEINQLIQQQMPMIESVASDIMEMTRDALAKGLPSETVVDILVDKMGFSKQSAQAVVSDLQKQIQSRAHETANPDVELMQSSLTQAVMADIALGVDTNTTVATLIAVGMPEAKAKAYVGTLLEAFMEMPVDEREETQQNIKQRMDTINKALSKGANEETLVQAVMQAEGFTRQQAEGIVNYCALVYRIRKPRNQ